MITRLLHLLRPRYLFAGKVRGRWVKSDVLRELREIRQRVNEGKNMREKENDKPIFSIVDRGYRVMAWYLKDTETSKGDALVEIYKDDVLLRSFEWPAYKIWNIGVHFRDIVDGELANNDSGYRMAAWTGIPNGLMR
jgi:hypothetical protein